MKKIETEPEIVAPPVKSVAQKMAEAQMAQQMAGAQVDPVTGMAQMTGATPPPAAPQQFDPLAGLGLGGASAGSDADDDDNSVLWAAAAAGATAN